MSSDVVISVSHLGKAYRQYPSMWSRLLSWLTPFFSDKSEQKWILQDLNFALHNGESLGIIGVNGAGKSTLLKLITGTSIPTTGSIKVNGRVAALLELGMGFHPDFTGRENAIVAGQLLGLSTKTITSLMPAIEEFAEIGEYIDRPTRIYSSGMQVRLAFSVATAVRPDILIIDEALSVGDSYFQHKSFERIKEFSRNGTALLIVSHDRWAIQNICSRALLIDGGRIVIDGKPDVVTDYYNAVISKGGSQSVKQVTHSSGRTQTISGDGEVVIKEVSLLNNRDEVIDVVRTDEFVKLKIVVEVIKAVPELVLGYMIKDRLSQPIYGTNTYHLGRELRNLTAGQVFEYEFTYRSSIGEGSYSIAVALHTTHAHLSKNYEWRDLALVFKVMNEKSPKSIGSSWMPPTVNITPLPL